MLQECPHCHAAVIPRRDKTCPNCQKRVTDLVGVDLSVTRVTIDNVRSLPPVCILCARDTKRLQRLRRSRDDPSRSGEMDLLLLEGGFLGLLLAKIMRLGKTDLYFTVPFCERCKASKRKLILKHLNWETHEATFLAHVDFKRRLVESGYYERTT